MKRKREKIKPEGWRYLVSATEAKQIRNEAIAEMLREGHSPAEVRKVYSLSEHRIAEIGREQGVDVGGRRFKRKKMKESGLLGTMPDKVLAKRFDVDPATVANARKFYKIKKFSKPIGCENCKNKPYANAGKHGKVCKRCYSRWLYWKNIGAKS